MIYIVVFLISLFFIAKASNIECNSKDKRFYIVLSTVLPILLAAFRGNLIGVDMSAYFLPWAQNVKHYESFTLFCKNNVDSMEYLYYALIFYPVKFTNSLFLSLLVQQVLIMYGVIKMLFYFKDKYDIDVVFGFAIYLLLFYNESLCIMRQSIAVSFAFLSLINYTEKRYVSFFIISIIAFFFHHSIISFTLILLIYDCLDKVISNIRIKLVLITVIIFAFSSLSTIFEVLSVINISERFEARFSGAEENDGGFKTIAMYAILVFIPYLLFLFRKNKYEYKSIWFYPVLGFVLIVLAKQSVYLGRLSYPFMGLVIITLPSVLSKNKILKYSIVLMLASFWYYTNVMMDTWGTNNYYMDRGLNF